MDLSEPRQPPMRSSRRVGADLERAYLHGDAERGETAGLAVQMTTAFRIEDSRRGKRQARAGTLAALLGLATLFLTWGGASAGAAIHGYSAAPQRSGSVAHDETLTLLNGRQVSLVAYFSHPVMVWFVAAGCASCAVSIPAVGSQLSKFEKSGVRILVLGLYGQFGTGRGARTELAGFGKAAAGRSFANGGWTWALASERLTAAYDPAGVPDAYFLLARGGRLVYHNAVPVSTMGALLGHLPRAAP